MTRATGTDGGPPCDPYVATFVEAVKTLTCAYLEEQQERILGYPSLFRNFTVACSAWKRGEATNTNRVTETVNELLVAKACLRDPQCKRIEYEPRLVRTPKTSRPKTIDFLFHTIEGGRIFYDVKTVHPDRGGTWDRYEQAQREAWFPKNTTVDWDDAFAHDAFTSRSRFLEHTLDLEEKIRHAGLPSDRTYYRMVFCGDGFRWHRSELAAFADTYFGRPTIWEHWVNV